MVQSPFRELKVSNTDIIKVVEVIEPVIMDFPATHVIMANLTIAIMLMCPNIVEDDLGAAIVGMSEWLCFYLAQQGYGQNTAPTTGTIN